MGNAVPHAGAAEIRRALADAIPRPFWLDQAGAPVATAHGLGNGMERFPDEIAQLDRLGRVNLDGIEASVRRYDIDCALERTGELDVATADWQIDGLVEHYAVAVKLGHTAEILDAAAVRAQVNSPTYVGGVWDRDGCAMLDPARLVWGLREACLHSACVSTSTRRCSASTARASGWFCTPHRAQWTPHGWHWAPVHTRVCCVACVTTLCRSTTTPS